MSIDADRLNEMRSAALDPKFSSHKALSSYILDLIREVEFLRMEVEYALEDTKLPCGHHADDEGSASGTTLVRGREVEMDADWCNTCVMIDDLTRACEDLDSQRAEAVSRRDEISMQLDRARLEIEALRLGRC